MTQEIATQLETLINSNADILPWDNIDTQWQEKIDKAIVSSTPPSHLISPHTQDSLANVVKCASENRWKLLPCGSGSKLNWGGLVADPQLVISTQHLNRIIEHAVGDLTVTVEAGVKLADLQAILGKHSQFLPLDCTYPDSATIGGIVATADAGSWRQRYGGVRDLVLGLSFIRSDGNIAKAGGRVVKNVAGYDLMKLLTGAYGTLGIISQVTFRLYPLLRDSQTLVVTGDKNSWATLTKTILKSSLTPIAAEILSTALVKNLDIGTGIGLMLRFQSIPESITAQSNQIETLAQQLGLQRKFYQQEDELNLWQRLQKILTIPATNSAITGKIGVMPNQAVNFLDRLDLFTTQQGLGSINMGSGLGRLQLEGENSLTQLQKLRSLCQEYQGFFTVLESPKSIKTQFEPWGYSGNAKEMMKTIKEKFDPNNILNPGRFFM